MSAKLDIVRKLLTKAERAATPEEAETYTAKAMELMAKHGIDDVMLQAAEGKPDAIDSRRVPIDGSYTHEKAALIGWTASPMGIETIRHSRGKKIVSITLYGFRSDLDRAEMLYTSLLLQATAQVLKERPSDPNESTRAYRRSWFIGFANEVHFRLKAMQEAAAAEHEGITVDGVRKSAELVLVDRKSQVDRVFQDASKGLKKAGPMRYTGSGFDDGAEAGRRADLGDKSLAPNRRALV